MEQYIYFLKLIPRLRDDKSWTQADEEIVDRHFLKLQELLNEGRLILAGRTTCENPDGIVILEVENETEAITIMENDPAVKEGIMTANLYPYRVALYRK